MQFLDRTGVGTLWSICKEKFALTGHTHNYAGSGSPGGSANSAIGVVDYNNPDDIIQIGYAPPLLDKTEILYIAGYTSGNKDVPARIKNISKKTLQSWLELGNLAYESNVDWSRISGVPTATTTQSGIMSAADKAKLNRIASGANNYTLPTASDTTLGGIKVSTIQEGTKWPISVDRNGIANTYISGLNRLDDCIGAVTIEGQSYRSTYYEEGVNITNKDDLDAQDVDIKFPYKSGIFALLSDIPNASNLCRFNFINSISECKSDCINFLLGFTGNIDITPLFNCNNGTILFMVTSDDAVNVGITSGNWSLDMEDYDYYTSVDVYKGKLCLATVYNSKIFFFRL